MSPPSLSPFSLNPLFSPTSSAALPSSLSLYFLTPNPHTHSIYSFKSFKFKLCCSHQTIQIDAQQKINPTKKKRKPRPSFLEQIQDKWSVKTISLREKLPWEEQEERESFEEEEEEEGEVEKQCQQFDELVVSESRIVKNSSVSDPASVASANRIYLAPSSVSNPVSIGSANRVNLAPWVQRSKPRNTQNDFEARNIEISSGSGKRVDRISNNYVQESKNLGKELKKDDNFEEVDDKVDAIPIGLSEKKKNLPVKLNNGLSFKGKLSSIDEEIHNFEDSRDECNSMRLTVDIGSDVKSVEEDKLRKMLPWERESDVKSVEGENLRKSNTMVAEKMIPEPELKRLRNVALRMVERIKVGAAGITQALVDSIHEKWKNDEVVKLKFEGPTAMNMRRSHEILERRTGGLVIWRSGSSIVLFRGMAYKLHCVKSFSNQKQANIAVSQPPNNIVNDFTRGVRQGGSDYSLKSSIPDSVTYMKGLSEEELMNLGELNFLLDELGPRFIDWAGCDPLPVDADLLRSVVPGYKRPFRLLPYGIRHVLRNKEMTFIRRTARAMPPHFALGRNRELQGLAMAMVKLWERSAIAKIAIKRGVHNTCNERMAEELKRLTGGTLVSRNKDYIVFYRGNDFLPPGVTKTLAQAQNLAAVRQDEEVKARQKALALMDSNAKVSKGPKLVAGTLAETMAATSRWGNQPSCEEREKMMRDLALARHASLVKFLETKLALANGKVKKAEKALRKVQDYLEPALLPTDLETLTDEERFLFRKIGLSMKPFLLLGRRGIFDGTIENMHLHWKYRELVKIIVDGKKFSQVKHIAIALEAESGGVLVSVDKTTKGYSIIVYRGKNYQRPCAVRPKNLLTRRQALARSIELQRREALKHHISELQEKIEKLKIELENMTTVNRIDEETFYSRVDDASDDDDDEVDDDNIEEDEDEEAYLEIYDSGDEDGNT